jgi:hypothetical protein
LTNTNGATGWIPLDKNNVDADTSIQCVVTGSMTYSVEQTLDDIFDSSATINAFAIPTVTTLTAATSSQTAFIGHPVTALRLTGSGTGSVVMRIVQQGII